MTETWLSYAPGDFLMFGAQVYWRLFELQNRALWPLPVIAGLAGMAGLILLATRRPGAARAALILAALSCLGAAHFLATRYAPINWPVVHAAWGFGLQALVLTILAIARPQRWPAGRGAAVTVTGWGLLGYATVLHPFAGPAFARPLAQAELVGIAPDPTALACLGLLSLVRPDRWGVALSVFPLAWCAVSAATLLTLGEAQGGVLIAGMLFWILGRGMSGVPPRDRA